MKTVWVLQHGSENDEGGRSSVLGVYDSSGKAMSAAEAVTEDQPELRWKMGVHARRSRPYYVAGAGPNRYFSVEPWDLGVTEPGEMIL